MAGENRAASRDLHPLARKRDFNGDTSNVKGHIKICLWQSNHTITDLATQRHPKKIFFDHALILLSPLNRRSSPPNRNLRSPPSTMIVMVSPSESSRGETTSREDFYTLTKDSLPQIDVLNGVETMIVDGGCTEAERAVDLGKDLDNLWFEDNGGVELGKLRVFQSLSHNELLFTMLDLINLAQAIAEDIYFWLKNNLEDDKQKKISNKARHSSCVASKYDGIKKFKIFDDARCLRTFLQFSPCRMNYIMRKQVYIANA